MFAAGCALAAAWSRPPLLALGAAAVLLLVVGLGLGRASAVPWAIAGLGVAYAATLGGDELDGRVPLFAAGLLVTGELAYWSLRLRGGAPDEPGMGLRRLIGVLVSAAVALVAGTMLVAVAHVPLRGGLAVEAVGIAAAIGALTILLVSARQT